MVSPLRPVVILAVAGACGGGSGPAPAPPVASPPPRTVHLALEASDAGDEGAPDLMQITLILTDETGATRREPIARLPGPCHDATGAAKGETLAPILALDCGEGTKLRLVVRGSQLIIVGGRPDEVAGGISFEPRQTIELPGGAAIRTDYDRGPEA
jgi:hypothetical protein